MKNETIFQFLEISFQLSQTVSLNILEFSLTDRSRILENPTWKNGRLYSREAPNKCPRRFLQSSVG